MRLAKAEGDNWFFQWDSDAERSERQQRQPAYIEAYPRYAGIFEAAFKKAKEKSEFAFVQHLSHFDPCKTRGGILTKALFKRFRQTNPPSRASAFLMHCRHDRERSSKRWEAA